MTNKQKYRNFCKVEKDIPIFSQDWWLDLVCNEDNWDVILYEKGGQIWGSMPYYKDIQYMFNMIIMPKFTQTMGPYIKYPDNQKYYKKLSWEKEIMNYFIDNLPKTNFFYQNFHYSITNWLPFYWKGFKQTTRYTYVIEDLTNLDDVISNFSHAKRKQFKKAIKNNIRVELDYITVREFYDLHKKELLSEGSEKISYSMQLLEKLYNTSKRKNNGAFFVAIDSNNVVHGALFVVWDKNSAYNLISAFNPKYFNSGATTLLIVEALKYFKSININKFDFEGSMLEGVENSFKQFSTVQKPYFQITKAKNRLFLVVFTILKG